MTSIISSGWCKGMKLAAPRGLRTRPTSVKVRSAVMNMLQGELDGARLVDLFAGTGGIGLEALSRGAVAAAFVEQDREALGALRANIEETRRRAVKQALDEPMMSVIARPLDRCWAELTRLAPFDLVWADPPWAEAATWFAEVSRHSPGILRPGGLLVFESGGKLDPVTLTEGWILERQREWGETCVTICRLAEGK